MRHTRNRPLWFNVGFILNRSVPRYVLIRRGPMVSGKCTWTPGFLPRSGHIKAIQPNCGHLRRASPAIDFYMSRNHHLEKDESRVSWLCSALLATRISRSKVGQGGPTLRIPRVARRHIFNYISHLLSPLQWHFRARDFGGMEVTLCISHGTQQDTSCLDESPLERLLRGCSAFRRVTVRPRGRRVGPLGFYSFGPHKETLCQGETFVGVRAAAMDRRGKVDKRHKSSYGSFDHSADFCAQAPFLQKAGVCKMASHVCGLEGGSKSCFWGFSHFECGCRFPEKSAPQKIYLTSWGWFL